MLLFAFGLVVPALVLAFNGEHKASVAVGGAAPERRTAEGPRTVRHSCAVCHTLAATKSVGRIGPNLDVRVGDDISTPRAQGARAERDRRRPRRGLGQMPALLYQGKEAEEVADFVAAVAGH